MRVKGGAQWGGSSGGQKGAMEVHCGAQLGVPMGSKMGLCWGGHWEQWGPMRHSEGGLKWGGSLGIGVVVRGGQRGAEKGGSGGVLWGCQWGVGNGGGRWGAVVVKGVRWGGGQWRGLQWGCQEGSLGEVMGVSVGRGGSGPVHGCPPTLAAPGPRFCPTLRLWLWAVSASQNLVPGAQQRRGATGGGARLPSPRPQRPRWGGER